MRKQSIGVLLLAGGILVAARLPAQDADAAAAPARPTEGPVIIHLPSAEVPIAGTLTLLFTHRFSQPLEKSDFHSLYSFDSGADIGIGLSYAPVKDLEIGFLRDRNLEDYELSAKYRVFSSADKPRYHAWLRARSSMLPRIPTPLWRALAAACIWIHDGLRPRIAAD